jgi:hypothetical protein
VRSKLRQRVPGMADAKSEVFFSIVAKRFPGPGRARRGAGAQNPDLRDRGRHVDQYAGLSGTA